MVTCLLVSLWRKKRILCWLTFRQIRNGLFEDFGLDIHLIRFRLRMLRKPEISCHFWSIATLLDQSPIPPFIGSNGWVIGEKKPKAEEWSLRMIPGSVFTTWDLVWSASGDSWIWIIWLLFVGTPYPIGTQWVCLQFNYVRNDDIDFLSRRE
jgi:penicillin amidase